MKNIDKLFLLIILVFCVLLTACDEGGFDESASDAAHVRQTQSVAYVQQTQSVTSREVAEDETISLSSIPEYSGRPYCMINGNEPFFSESEMTTDEFETYSSLDELGRCGTAYANICTAIMPTEERQEIGYVKPAGWQSVKYDIVDGRYLYNRCHLIGYQLAGENANEKNLITGTRYMNVEGMLPFENMVADYVKETDGHVLYRVTPMYEGENLVADGVLMEACSVEDGGTGVEFNVFVYNVQPGIYIDYLTGDSCEDVTFNEPGGDSDDRQELDDYDTNLNYVEYILNTNSKKFHKADCSSVDQISEKNRAEYSGDRDELISMGYNPCRRCNP